MPPTSFSNASRRGWLAAWAAVLSACSLLAPTDAALTGGASKTGAAGEAQHAGARGTGDAGAAAAPGGESGSAGSASTSGGTTAGTESVAGSSAGGASAGAGPGSCVSDVTSSRLKASSLRDDFADGVPEPGFRLDGDSSCGAEVDGQFRVALPAPLDPSYYCYYETISSYDLTCDAIVVKVTGVVGPSLGLQTFLYVTDPSRKLFVLVENGAYLIGVEGGSSKLSGRYSATEPWWRLSETALGGKRMIVFETSADAVSWTEQARIDRPFRVDNVKIALGAGAYEASTSPGVGVFACYNSAQTCD